MVNWTSNYYNGTGAGAGPTYSGTGADFYLSGGGSGGGGLISPYKAPAIPTPALIPESVGISPQEFAALLYGKPIPPWIGGKSLIGCRVIEGPFFTTVGGETVVSGIAAACIPLNYANDTRRITQLRLSGKEAWNGTATSASVTTASTPTSGLNVGGATTGTEQRIRFLFGTNTQSPDASSVARYGADAQSYNPLVCVVFDNIRTAPYGNVVPFFSIILGDTQFGDPNDGVTWQEIADTLAAFDGRTADFEARNLSGRVDALILGSPTTLPSFFASMRTANPHWSILTDSKYRVIDKGPFSLDLMIDRDNIIENGNKPIVFARGDATESPREMIVSFIDSNRDYEPSTVSASEDIDATPSFQTTQVDVPIVTTAIEMLSLANFAYYWRETARLKAEYIGALAYSCVEPSDVHRIDTAARSYFQSVTEVSRNPDFTTDIKTEGFLTCGIAQSGGTYAIYIFDESCHLYSSVDGIGAIFTQTSTPASDTGLPYTTMDDSWTDMVMAVNDNDYTTLALFDPQVHGGTYNGISYSPDLQGAVQIVTNYLNSENLSLSPMRSYSSAGDGQGGISGAITAGGQKILVPPFNYFSTNYPRMSNDYGATWSDVTGVPADKTWTRACFSESAAVMYLHQAADSPSTHGAMWKSGDSGATWAALSGAPSMDPLSFGEQIPGAGDNSLRLRCSKNGSVVAVIDYNGRFFISDDGGVTWRNTDFSVEAGSTIVAADFGMDTTGSTVLVGATDSASHTYLFISTDTGTTWTDITSRLNPPAGAAGAAGFTNCNVSPDGVGMVVVYGWTSGSDPTLTAYIDVSLDAGGTWTPHTFTMDSSAGGVSSPVGVFVSTYIVPV